MLYLTKNTVESVKTCASWLFVYLLLLTVVLAFYWRFNNIKHSQNKILRVLSLIFNKGFLAFSIAEMVVVPINIFTPDKPGLIKLSSLLIPTFAVLIVLCFAGAGICGGFYLEELQDEKLEDEDNTSKYGNHMSDADTYMSIANDHAPLNGPENIEKNHEIYKNRYFKQAYDLDKDLTTKLEALPYSQFMHKRNTPENIEENHRRHANKNKPENLKQTM